MSLKNDNLFNQMQCPFLNPVPEAIKKFMLISAEHEIFLLINVKMLTIVGVLTFMSRKNSIFGLSEPAKS